MKAIVNTGPNVLELRDMPPPEPGPGQVRVRTAACGICATDLKVMAGEERGHFPRILGHEWSGVVDAVGDGVDDGLRGKRCVAENVLADGGEVGFEHPGGYAECFLTEAANVQTLSDEYPFVAGALIEPLAVCVRGLDRLAMSEPSSAVIFGDGPIGLILLPMLARAGVRRTVLVGGRPARLSLATELGADAVVNYHDVAGDLADAVLDACNCEPANVIEASGSAAAMDASIRLAATGGRILVVGDYDGARADFVWDRVLHRELAIIGSNASAGAWPEAVRIAVAGDVPLSRLVTTTLPVTEFARAIELTRNSREQIKVVMEWE